MLWQNRRNMKKVLVIGLGISGIGSLKLLKGRAELFAYDAKKEEEIKDETKALLDEMGVSCFFGTDPKGPFDQVVVSPAVPMDNPIVSKLRSEGSEIIGEMELAYRYCKGSFIGITGTNGKTTTTTLVGEIMKNGGKDTMVVGNIGAAVSEVCEKATEDTVMVTELSSFQLETVSEFHVHISAILNLTPDHLDRHKTFEGYIAAKARILENQTLADFFIYNADDPETAKLAETVDHVNKVPFSAKEGCESLSLLSNAAYVSEGNIVVKAGGKEHKICPVDALQIPGHHNLENALAAAAIGIFAGIKAKSIGKTMRAFKGVEHRLEFVRELKGVRYINDSKGTNPDASIKALEAMPAPIIIIAGGYDKHLDFTDYINAMKGKVEYMLLLGATADQIEETALKCGFSDDRIIKCSSLEVCVASAAKLAEKGFTVLLSPACASWGMFENYEQRGREFKRLVKEL